MPIKYAYAPSISQREESEEGSLAITFGSRFFMQQEQALREDEKKREARRMEEMKKKEEEEEALRLKKASLSVY